MALEKVRLRACGIGSCCLGVIAQSRDRTPVYAAAAPGTSLVGQHDAEMLDGLLDPAIACGRQRTRALAAGAALQKEEERQVVVNAVGRANHAVEELDAFGCTAMGAGIAPRRMVLPTAKSMGSRPRQSRGTSMLWSST